MVLKATLLGLLCVAQFAISQPTTRVTDFNQHAWYTYSGDHPVSRKWGVHLEGQWRRSDLGAAWQQYLLRPGVNYALSRSTQLTLGYALVRTYPYGDYPLRTSVPEHRIYQQALVTHTWRSLRFQHRPRLEQRFIKYPDPQPRTWTYQNRFRYMLRAEIPLVSESNGRAIWYLPTFNEILIGIAPNYGARPFDQNRLFVGIGRALPGAKVEVGYMNQYIGQRNGRVFEFNNTLFVGVTSNVPLSGLWSD